MASDVPTEAASRDVPRQDPATAPDHAGRYYHEVLRDFHAWLRPRTYLEIGTESGATLALSTAESIAVDPRFQLASGALVNSKRSCHFYSTTSDDFFRDHSPSAILGNPVDLAFLDGMHRCEFLLRDIINTERHCRPNSIILLHDCLPVDDVMTARVPEHARPAMPGREGWWTGDVWRTALALKRHRPDLAILALDAASTGLVALTNLDPRSTVLSDRYRDVVAEMLSWSLDLDAFFAEMDVQSTASVDTPDKMTRHFWL